MIVLYSLLYLGTALFWAAYAIDGVFGEEVAILRSDPAVRLGILIIATGIFSAVYTYLGGMRAVVRTDIVQLVLLVVGGVITLSVAIHHLGGWSSLWTTTGDLMHLHLPRDHGTLPWTGLFGMFLLNLNYWGANRRRGRSTVSTTPRTRRPSRSTPGARVSRRTRSRSWRWS